MGENIKTTAEAVEAAVLPDAKVVHADPNMPKTAEQIPLPAGVAKKPVAQKSAAEWAYERIVLYIQNFEAQLDNDHEVGMGFAGGDLGVMRIQGMGFFAPDIITYYGTDMSGAKTQLVQHVSQLNVMLRAAPKESNDGAAQRIGFRLAAELNGEVAAVKPGKAPE